MHWQTLGCYYRRRACEFQPWDLGFRALGLLSVLLLLFSVLVVCLMAIAAAAAAAAVLANEIVDVYRHCGCRHITVAFGVLMQ